jgi:hypothetical protein
MFATNTLKLNTLKGFVFAEPEKTQLESDIDPIFYNMRAAPRKKTKQITQYARVGRSSILTMMLCIERIMKTKNNNRMVCNDVVREMYKNLFHICNEGMACSDCFWRHSSIYKLALLER